MDSRCVLPFRRLSQGSDTPFAQIEAIADFARFLSVFGDPIHRTGPAILKRYKPALEKLVATCMHLRQPDNTFPPLGPLPAPNFDADELCTIVNSELSA